MDRVSAQVTIVLVGMEDVDRRELDELTLDLRERLLELDVSAVDLARLDGVPAGAKSVDPAVAGMLVVTLTPLLLRAVVQVSQAWLQHRPVRNVKLVIGDRSVELTAASKADQEKIVNAFIARLDDE